MIMSIPKKSQQDFWEFALEPDNRRKMDIIAKGAEIFATKLKITFDRERRNQSESEMVQNLEYEAYPMDTFTVIVSFNVRDLHVSLNLEEIRFLGNKFEAERRIYIWKENGSRKIEEKSLGPKVYELKLEEVENSFLEMYKQIKYMIHPTINLPDL
jgi:hypothetical protein